MSEPTPLPNSTNGTPLDGMIAAVTDARLQEAEPRFREMVDLLPFAIYTTDAEGRLTYFNRAAVEFSGRVPELRTDQWCVTWKLYYPDGTPMPHDACPMAIALKEGRIVRGAEAIAERPDGKRIWFTPYPTPLFDDDGRVIGGINMLVDITERKRAEQALRDSEAQLRLVTDAMPALISYVDATECYRFINKAYERWFGHPRAEVYGKSLQEVLGAPAYEAIRPYVEQALAGREVTFESQVPYRDGGIRWIQASYVPQIAHGRIEGFFALVMDITERKRIELELARTQRNLQDFLDNGAVALHWVGPDGRILWANEAELTLLGYTHGEYIGHHIAEFHVDQEVIADILARLGRNETIHEYEARLRCKDGTIKDVLIDSNVLWEDGKFMHTRCFTRDITARKQGDASRARLAALVESSVDAIISKDLNGIIATWNKGAERIFGYTAEEARGRSIAFIIPPERLHEEQMILARIRRGEPVEHYETVRLRKDGQRLPISLTVSPIKDDSGRIIGASKIARDIAERKRAEEQAAASLREKEVLLKEIHHRVKNNLQIVSGLLNLQYDAVHDAKVREIFDESRNRIKSIALVHETLYSATNLATIEMAAYIQRLIDQLRDVYGNNIAIEVRADGMRFDVDTAVPCGLILNELVSNAMKHAFPASQGCILVELAPAGDQQVALVVQDDGIGIPAQIDPRTTESLGLRLVDTLVHQLGGSLHIDRGPGTRVTVRFARDRGRA